MVKKQNAADIVSQKSTYLIYANPGVGKTYALGYLPGKTLILDIDQSSSTLSKHPNKENIDIWQLDSSNMWQEWLDVTSELVKNKDRYEKEYDNICVDNLTELFKAQLEDLGKKGNNSGVPSQANYQQSDFMNLRSLRALNSIDCRIILTAWESSMSYTDVSGQMFSKFVPDIREKIINNYLGLCDVVARLIVSEDKEGNRKRGFILQPTQVVEAKNRLDDRKGCLVSELVTGGE
ncbi:AAA family ATPase [Desemzia sp. RIT804]|uniref:AAA family ATPase n=1 Tax=Desemzia sp. RIT 804 TaxID=2810209 RepID=UPI001950487E|nr:AAA family ATPase [Desemzia sp. RIT 804]MBM6615600.1 AAA family ATPase [Desemzia sp. RIT 804]